MSDLLGSAVRPLPQGLHASSPRSVTRAVLPLDPVNAHVFSSSSDPSCPPLHDEAVRASPVTLPGCDLRMTPEVTARLHPGRGPSTVSASFTQLCQVSPKGLHKMGPA